MNEKSDGLEDGNADNLSDSAVVEECEREMQDIFEWSNLETESHRSQRQIDAIVEKRNREESGESDDEDFTTVTRRRPKRLHRSNSSSQPFNGSSTSSGDEFQVCITSLQILPKQMALAKILKAERIDNILRIKYKNPYKVLIQLKNKNQAEILMKCPKLLELGCRCHIISELNISYGVVKGVDLEMDEKELMETFESTVEIISLNRLKRLDTQGKWVNSETIRIGFKNPILPEYIHAYGCRFKVERYVFPVTQCSGCWKFGHLVKFCPLKKIKCPKCGDNHINCEKKEIKCLNCKGNHIVLDKTCPVFLKEKKIRNIMSEQNLPYKKALEFVLSDKEIGNQKNVSLDNGDSQSVILPTTSVPTWASRVKEFSSNNTSSPTSQSETTLFRREEKRKPTMKQTSKTKFMKRISKENDNQHSQMEEERYESEDIPEEKNDDDEQTQD
ncbi:uncharacterized protein LOC114365134 [Ostrinia furnacalis]|uniref:uncharacterized protein LOC114365134 n=1 Tax=Ostrinia furnacalis TaxID=93504 RepID=UPI00103F5CE5|nr:uncharacterized protein LOC114365134 [Ostrinia furnacalis]